MQNGSKSCDESLEIEFEKDQRGTGWCEVNSNREIMMISVNNTTKPRTGGEYVYKVIKEELLTRHFTVHEISVPLLLQHIIKETERQTSREMFYRLLIHFRCVFQSLMKRFGSRYLILTSSSPAFPVFGHLVYHQPKTGVSCKMGREHLSLYEKSGFTMLENERLSPLWWLAKRSHILHLSNSIFTKRLIKNLYNLDSFVLYPPVPVPPSLDLSRRDRRVFAVIVVRPKAVSGIALLPDIIKGLTKTVQFLVIGRADPVGLKVIQNLRKKRVRIKYLGFVSENTKRKLFSTFSHYLHLGLNESFGITVVEAMAGGCIPIAPNSGAIPEYLPVDLLYSNSIEAAEKIDARIGLEDFNLKIKLQNIAEKFREENFRAKFTTYVRILESLMSGTESQR